jgi:putative phosphoserine phosphatase/1-acylglycerol-3-phosphate O-acyltransferase
MNQRPERIAAIFDMDYTLLAGSSAKMLMDYLRQTDQLYDYLRWRDLPSIFLTVILYRLGMMDPTHLFERIGQALAGRQASDLWDVSQAWFKASVIRTIREGGRERLEWHRAQGHIPVICSGSSQFAVNLLADYLDISEWICSEWIVQDGVLTGQLRQPLTYGEGKVYWMEQWASQHGVDLAKSYFYTDHISDIPLLERVAHPIAVHPDRQLARLARQRAWQVHVW